MKLFHPDRFAHEPEKQETYHKLTAAIWPRCAASRKTTVERMGFILRQGWAALDFGEERELAQLRCLWEGIELEILRVLEAGNAGKIRNPNVEIRNKFQSGEGRKMERVRRLR